MIFIYLNVGDFILNKKVRSKTVLKISVVNIIIYLKGEQVHIISISRSILFLIFNFNEKLPRSFAPLGTCAEAQYLSCMFIYDLGSSLTYSPELWLKSSPSLNLDASNKARNFSTEHIIDTVCIRLNPSSIFCMFVRKIIHSSSFIGK